jgi:antirestriction protein
MPKNFNPKIYVACLAAYNNGYHHGTWIDATQSVEAINEEIQAMLKQSPIPHAEEWAIHDYDDFGNLRLGEYENLETVTQIASFIAEQGELGMALLDYTNHDVSAAKRLLEECYEGKHENERQFAYQLFTDCHEIPEYLEPYIDYDRIARDLFMCDYFSLNVNCNLHVFKNQ